MTWVRNDIDLEVVRGKLEGTRVIRLALDALEEKLPADLVSGHLVLELVVLRKLLAALDRERIGTIEHRDYMILAPVSDLERFGDKAAEAVKTLDDWAWLSS